MIDEFIDIHVNIKEKLHGFVEQNQVPNMLFHGPSGSGKRTLVKQFVDKLYINECNDLVMYVDCGHGKGIKFIREEVNYFAKMNCSNVSFKLIVLLNADKLTIDAQSALRRTIELYCKNTRFIIIVHEKSKLLKPLVSRFCEIFVPLPLINEKNVNLHHYKKEIGFLDLETKKTNALKNKMKKISNDSSIEDLFELTNEHYTKGYTGLNFLEYMLQDKYSSDEILIIEQYKNQIKSEKLLIFCILTKLKIRSKNPIKNIV